jgi:hypothetical protein
MDRAGRRLGRSAVCHCTWQRKHTSSVIWDSIGRLSVRDGIIRVLSNTVHLCARSVMLKESKWELVLRVAQGC